MQRVEKTLNFQLKFRVIQKISIDDFMAGRGRGLVIDVRSPSEYAHAHIPGAVSLPLFSDDERRIVGTAYKQESRQKAIKLGMAFFGPKMVALAEDAERLYNHAKAAAEEKKGKKARKTAAENPENASPSIVVHCWRGGMRSAAMAWLLDLNGFEVSLIIGGYKAYRRWALSQLEKPYSFKVIGGGTGSGKTTLLGELNRLGFKTLDLEGLANHRGSAFGSIGMPPQPGQEMFENLLALKLHDLTRGGSQPREEVTGEPGHPPIPDYIFVEDESQRIGLVNIPMTFYQQIRVGQLLYLDIPFEQRLIQIVNDYGKGETDKLVNAIIRIKKRLGGLEAKTAINHLLEGEIAGCFAILLHYYDKWYKKGLHNLRPDAEAQLTIIPCPGTSAPANAVAVIGAVVEE